MLHQGSDLEVSSSELLDRYEGIMRNPLIWCASACTQHSLVWTLWHPPSAWRQLTPSWDTYRCQAAGELGIDHHRNRDSANSREFLLLVLKWVRPHPTLKDLPLVLHVRMAKLDSDAAAVECINAMRHAGLHADHKVYLHCYVAGRATQRMWMNNFQNTVFGAGSLLVWGRCHVEAPPLFGELEWQQIMVETDAPSINFGGRKNGPPTTPMSTYEVSRWLASVRNVPLREVLQEVRKSLRYFYGL